MSFFDINYDLLRLQLLPVRLRNNKMKAWLSCLISPIKWLHNKFRAARIANLYYLDHSGQVVFLEASLNDVFDPVSRGIYIIDGLYEDPVFLFLEPEVKPVWLGLGSEAGATSYASPAVLFTDAETSLLGNSFIVRVPVTLPFDNERMKAHINRYRLAGRNVFGIETY
jgi:hypothetical protein